MASDSQDSTRDNAIVAWVQTRVVLRIVAILLAVAAFLWIVYKLTTVLLLVVLSVFFAYPSPLVDWSSDQLTISGKDTIDPRGWRVESSCRGVFGVGLAIIFWRPTRAQFPSSSSKLRIFQSITVRPSG